MVPRGVKFFKSMKSVFMFRYNCEFMITGNPVACNTGKLLYNPY